MFKIRGNTNNTKHVRYAKDCESLSEAIHINQLCKNEKSRQTNETSKSSKELSGRRKHFEGFRETYQQRLRRAQKKYAFDSDLESSKYQQQDLFFVPKYEDFDEYKQHEMEVKELLKKPLLSQPFKQMKTIKVEVPVPHKTTAVWCPSKAKSQEKVKAKRNQHKNESLVKEDAYSILRKIEELEASRNVEAQSHPDLFCQLQEANEQVDVASLQLQHIHNLIKNRKASLEQQGKDDKKKSQIAKGTRWFVGHIPKSDGTDKAKKLAKTLQTFNSRLQTMQERMMKTTFAYKSINDILKAPLEEATKSVEVLYKKEKGPEWTAEAAKEESQDAPSTKFEEILEDILNGKHKRGEFEDAKNETHRKPYRSALARILENEEEKSISESPRNEKPKLGFLKQNSSSVDVLLPPQHKKEMVESQYNLVMKEKKAKTPPDKNEKMATKKDIEDSDDITISSVFDEKLHNSVLKSSYLAKEFNVMQDKCINYKKGNKVTKEEIKNPITDGILKKLEQKNKAQRKIDTSVLESISKSTLYTYV